MATLSPPMEMQQQLPIFSQTQVNSWTAIIAAWTHDTDNNIINPPSFFFAPSHMWIKNIRSRESSPLASNEPEPEFIGGLVLFLIYLCIPVKQLEIITSNIMWSLGCQVDFIWG